MKKVLGTVMAWPGQAFENAKVRKGVLATIAAVIVFLYYYYYFFRELVAAELLFGAGLAVFLVFVGFVYVVGVMAEQGLRWVEAGIRVTAESGRLWYAGVVETKKLAERKVKTART